MQKYLASLPVPAPFLCSLPPQSWIPSPLPRPLSGAGPLVCPSDPNPHLPAQTKSRPSPVKSDLRVDSAPFSAPLLSLNGTGWGWGKQAFTTKAHVGGRRTENPIVKAFPAQLHRGAGCPGQYAEWLWLQRQRTGAHCHLHPHPVPHPPAFPPAPRDVTEQCFQVMLNS